MFKKINDILKEVPYLHRTFQRKGLREKIEAFLKSEGMESAVDFKIASPKEIRFFCQSHSAMNALKMREEQLRKTAEAASAVFRYFLK